MGHRRATDLSLLGTVVELSISTGRFSSARGVQRAVFGELRRLQDVFNRFDERSELSRFRRSIPESVPDEAGSGGAADISAELAAVLGLAERWHERSDGLFDPAPGFDGLPYQTSADGTVKITGDCSTVDANAVAKGWIVDRAAELVRSRVRSLTINAGGDVLHRGSDSILVGIEDPLRAYDNVAPLLHVELSNAAIATSGPARRGQHLLNPRTGAAPTAVAGASVVAHDAATADAMATVLAVAEPEEGLRLADREGLAALIIDADGGRHQTSAWAAVVAKAPSR